MVRLWGPLLAMRWLSVHIGIMISMKCTAITVDGSMVIRIPGLTDIMPVSRPDNSHRPVSFLCLYLRSLVDRGGYDAKDFCRRMDEELLPLLDGTLVSGPGGYIPASPFVKYGGSVYNNCCRGRRPAVMPIPPKP